MSKPEPPTIECSCSGPGQCPLRGRVISEQEFALCKGTCGDPNFCSPELCARRRVRWDNERRAREGLPARPLPVVVNGARVVRYPDFGPGTELKKLLKEMGVSSGEDCGCDKYAKEMNLWGVDGCRGRESEIVRHLVRQVKGLSAAEVRRLVTGAWEGFGFPIHPLHPVRSIVREAIRRAGG